MHRNSQKMWPEAPCRGNEYFIHKSRISRGDLTLTWYTYRYVPAFWGAFPTNFSIGIGRFSSKTKSGVIWVNDRKAYLMWRTLGAFLLKMVYRWVGNWVKNWYKESQILRSSRHTHIRFWQKYPLPENIYKIILRISWWWSSEVYPLAVRQRLLDWYKFPVSCKPFSPKCTILGGWCIIISFILKYFHMKVWKYRWCVRMALTWLCRCRGGGLKFTMCTHACLEALNIYPNKEMPF